MIGRIWHGWTSPENAETYEKLLREEVFPSIEAKNVKGYRKISLLKRKLANECEFITIMLFDDLESVKAFAGEEYERAYVPDKARAVLLRFDVSSQHYEIIHDHDY